MSSGRRKLDDVKEQAAGALSAVELWKRDQQQRDADQSTKLAEQTSTIAALKVERRRLHGKMCQLHRDLVLHQQRYEDQMYNT